MCRHICRSFTDIPDTSGKTPGECNDSKVRSHLFRMARSLAPTLISHVVSAVKFNLAKKANKPALLIGLLLLAGYLRIAGLTWGLENGYGHYRNFQPDEFVSLRGVLEVDLLRGHIKAPSAYFEGTFNYYLWAVPQAALKLSSKTGLVSTASTKMEMVGHARLLYVCRWMSVLLDLCTVILVFLAIREAIRNFYPGLLGAFVYAVLPMQVIYAHFMRTHLLSNFLCALVIWLSLRFRKRQERWMSLTVGCISGLAAATRIPNGIIVVIPCLYFLFDGFNRPPTEKIPLRERTKHFLKGPILLIGFGFAFGLFVGYPMLFLDLPGVINAAKNSVLPYATLGEFKTSNLLNLWVVWKYVSSLIPFAMYPLLWLLPYLAILYLCLRRSLYHQSFPIMIFSGLYLYFMAKGYVGPYFARATMLLFPGFCILLGLAFSDLWLLLKRHRAAAISLVTAPLILALPSVAFDAGYVKAMSERDSRSVLREDLQKLVGTSSVTLGIFSGLGGYFYTVMPAVEPLKSDKVAVRLQDLDQKTDFFLVGFKGPIDLALLDLTIKKVEAQGNFRYEKTYSVHPKILGQELRLARFPSDMTYPFPTILLFRSKTET